MNPGNLRFGFLCAIAIALLPAVSHADGSPSGNVLFFEKYAFNPRSGSTIARVQLFEVIEVEPSNLQPARFADGTDLGQLQDGNTSRPFTIELNANGQKRSFRMETSGAEALALLNELNRSIDRIKESSETVRMLFPDHDVYIGVHREADTLAHVFDPEWTTTPWLLQEVRSLRSELDKCRQDLKELREQCTKISERNVSKSIDVADTNALDSKDRQNGSTSAVHLANEPR